MDDQSKAYSRFLSKARPEGQKRPGDEGAGSAVAESSRRAGQKRLVLSATSKGGVGKSFVSINLAEWLRLQGVDFVAFDPDWCNSSLTRFYPEAEFIDISEAVHLDNVIRALERADLVLVDGVGSLQMKFIEWLEETRVFDLREELGLDITLIVIIEEDKETVFQAGQAAKRVGSRADWLVIRNLKTSPVTEIYDASNARKELLALGAREMTLDRLPWNLSSILQRTSKSIGGLVSDEEIFFLERQRLRTYQQRLFGEFAGAREILLPGSMLAAPTPAAGERPGVAPGRPRIPPDEV